VGILDIFAYDLAAMIDDLPIVVEHKGRTFGACRTELRRSNALGEGGFLEGAACAITAHYDANTQQVNLGDIVTIDGRKFRVLTADLAQDGVSVTITLEDINR